jgi:Ca-activated chloride channel homolog
VLVAEGGSTLVTLAQDVKLQLEFNPEKVGAYRLIGYENRRLATQDFNDDQKDAGELGAGHSVTALYELVPPGTSAGSSVDALRYQAPGHALAGHTGELCTIKLRYKRPGSEQSQMFERPVTDAGVPLAQTSAAFRFSAAVATFGMTLRASPERGRSSYALARELARGALGQDPHGYQHEFIGLVDTAATLDRSTAPRPLAMP